MRRSLLKAVILTLLTWAPAAWAGNAEDALARSRSALVQRLQLPDLTFTDTENRPVRLSQYLGKPLLISMIYTGCVDVCPTLLESLNPAIEAAQKALGEDSFASITVGFDVRHDTPSRLRSYARARGIDLPNWKFVAADQESLDTLARAVGFGIYSRAGGFDHLAQVSVIDGRGRLYQQIYGTGFEPPLIVDPLKALVFGRDEPVRSFEGLLDRIRYFCTVYDPNSGRYYFNYSIFLTIGIGLASFAAILSALVREWRRSSAAHSERR